MKTTNTTTLSALVEIPETLFPAMMEAGPYAGKLRAAGYFVTVRALGDGLSGDAYQFATREGSYAVSARAFEVGDGATVSGYSDADAYTVTARTAKTLTLRADKQTLLNGTGSGAPDALQFSRGGFVGHTSGRQRWECQPDTNGRTVTARLTLKGWQADGKSVGAGRRPHYDFNF